MEIGFFKLLAFYGVLLVSCWSSSERSKPLGHCCHPFQSLLRLAAALQRRADHPLQPPGQGQEITPRRRPPLPLLRTAGCVLHHPRRLFAPGYPCREDGLRQLHFIDALKQRGFYVADVPTRTTTTRWGRWPHRSTTITSTISLPRRTAAKPPWPGHPEQRHPQRHGRAGYQFVTVAGYSSFNDIQNSDVYLNVVNAPEMQAGSRTRSSPACTCRPPCCARSSSFTR